MSKLPCYHVTTALGEIYGVAATTVKDSMTLVQDRLATEFTGATYTADKPVSAKRVAMWDAPYGTVLHY